MVDNPNIHDVDDNMMHYWYDEYCNDLNNEKAASPASHVSEISSLHSDATIEYNIENENLAATPLLDGRKPDSSINVVTIVDDDDFVSRSSNGDFNQNMADSDTRSYSSRDSIIGIENLTTKLANPNINSDNLGINHEMLFDKEKPVPKGKKKTETKEEKELKKLQKAKLREAKLLEKQRSKQIKASLAAKQKSLKPEEAIKHLIVNIDTKIINSSYGALLIPTLQKEDIKYSVENLLIPYTITWTKQNKTNDSDETPEKEEEEMLKLMTAAEFVDCVANEDLLAKMLSWKRAKRKLTLIILGLEKYWGSQARVTNQKLKSAVTGTLNRAKSVDSAAVITPEDAEMALIQVQLMTSYSHRNIENGEDLALLVYQWTKSISQKDFKRGQYCKERDTLSWFAKADSKGCIKVDKKGNGLLELWQQQICQFSSIGLEVAQAIVADYPSPQALLTAYRRLGDPSAAADMLADIEVRRNAGILASTRRVGPELSRKIHRFFTCTDPSLPI